MLKVVITGVFTTDSTNYAQANGFENNSCKLFRFEIKDIIKKYGRDYAQTSLIHTLHAARPDFMVICKGTGIDVETIKECQKYTKVYLWFMDAYLPHHWTTELQAKIRICDKVFCDKLQAVKAGLELNKNTIWACEGFDSSIERIHNLPRKYDVSFIGNIYDDRSHIVQLSGAKVFKAYAEEHAKIVSQSRINLNICTGNCASDRVYKIMAAEGFLLTNDWEGRSLIFKNGVDLVIWKDINDLQDKIDYYLEHVGERRRIASKGFEAVQRFSRDKWAKIILDSHIEI